MVNEATPPHYKAIWFKCFVTKFDDDWKDLTIDERKELLYTAVLYVRGESLPKFDNRVLTTAWNIYKREIDKDLRSYQSKVENGKKGGRPKKTGTDVLDNF